MAFLPSSQSRLNWPRSGGALAWLYCSRRAGDTCFCCERSRWSIVLSDLNWRSGCGISNPSRTEGRREGRGERGGGGMGRRRKRDKKREMK